MEDGKKDREMAMMMMMMILIGMREKEIHQRNEEIRNIFILLKENYFITKSFLLHLFSCFCCAVGTAKKNFPFSFAFLSPNISWYFSFFSPYALVGKKHSAIKTKTHREKYQFVFLWSFRTHKKRP